MEDEHCALGSCIDHCTVTVSFTLQHLFWG